MPKTSATIGYVSKVKTEHNVVKEQIIERTVGGDMLNSYSKFNVSDSVNGTLSLSNRFSFIGDAYSFMNYGSIRYVRIRGVNWEVSTVGEKRPRLVLEIGGKYNGPLPTG